MCEAKTDVVLKIRIY